MALSLLLRQSNRIIFPVNQFAASQPHPIRYAASFHHPHLFKNNKSLCPNGHGISVTAPRYAHIMSPSVHWRLERLMAVIIFPCFPLCVAFPTPILDYLAAFSIGLHIHLGAEGYVIDYIRANIFGQGIRNIAKIILKVLTIFTFCGLMWFNYNDVGLGRGLRMLWAIDGSAPPPTYEDSARQQTSEVTEANAPPQ